MSAFRVSPSQLATLNDVIRRVTRVSGLPADDADDFYQHVHLRLLERNYEPLARFAGRSSFRTYLFVVVKRLLLDWRNEHSGKWRPSSLATRLGPLAVGLDRLMSRDGCSRDEAVAVMSAHGSKPAARLLRELADRIPQRQKVQFVVPEQPDQIAAVGFVDPIERREAVAAEQRALRALRRAYAALPLDDRRLLYLRFQRRLSVASIATLLDTPAKPLYVRLKRVLRTLRQGMGQPGGVRGMDRTVNGGSVSPVVH